MTKVSINNKEYETEGMTPEQIDLVNLLNLGKNSVTLLDHILKCTSSVQQMKTEELTRLLEVRPTFPNTLGDLVVSLDDSTK